MSTTPIKDVKNGFYGNVGTVAKSLSATGTGDFLQVFNKTQGNVSQNLEKETDISTSNQKTERSEELQSPVKVNNKVKTEQVKDKTESFEKKSEKEISEVVEQTGNLMKEKVAETLEVSVEEVEAALEVLGLSALDLLNPDNLTKVVLELNPGTDALTLMTNEELFMDLKALMMTADELVNQMKEQLELSGDTKELLSLLKNSLFQDNLMNQIPEETMEAVTALDEFIGVSEDENQSSKFTTRMTEELTVAKDTSIEASAAMKVETVQEKKSSQGQEDSGNMARQSFNQNLLNQLAESVESSNSSQGIYGASGQEIIEQITELIKIHVKSQTTEVELQLHPASLGNVKVQIASTEGVLTATFTTQNEAVKAALEAQLIQLKENFAQQGLKVESIEVNVATQGFERSLDQQNQGNRDTEENSKKSGRRIRLSGLESLEDISLEELPEEDKVVADMMIRNGNTVDYTV